MKKKLTALIGLAVIAAIVFIAGIIVEKNTASKKEMSVKDYYGLKGDAVKLIINTEESEEEAVIKDENGYISFHLAKTFLKRLYYDSTEDTVIFTDPEKKYTYEPDNTEYRVNDDTEESDFPFVIKAEGNIMVALELVKKFYYIETSVMTNPNIILIFSDAERKYDIKRVTGETEIRTEADIKSPILKEVKEGDKLWVLGTAEDGKFIKVLSEDGVIGFALLSKLGESEIEMMDCKREDDRDIYTSIKQEEPVVLAWHQVFNQSANSNMEEFVSGKTEYMNVISPTWFGIADNTGELLTLASKDYVERAHNLGLKVWPLVNDFNKDVDYKALFSSNAGRTNLINNIVYFIDSCGFDGINIDFESVKASYAEDYLQFLRELSIVMRKKKKVLSIDNYVPTEYTAHYDREEQGILADYVCVMAYDEHYAGSKEAGSVSSLNWVRTGISKTKEVVDPKKIIVGLPFYTRIWRINPDGSLTSKALGMQGGKKRVAEAGAEKAWDDVTGQYYAEWKDGNDTMKIWLEEAQSLKNKLSEVDKNELGGVAFWKLGLENEGAWKSVATWLGKEN